MRIFGHISEAELLPNSSRNRHTTSSVFYIHMLYKIENKAASLEKNLLCNLLCPDNMHNYIPPKDNKTHFHIVKL